MSVFKIIVKPVRGQMDNVYLYLYKFSSGMKIPELTSLKIKVQKKYCVFNGGQFIRVSKKIPLLDLKHLGFSSIELLNDFLNDKLSDFISIQGDRNFVSNENKTLNDFFEMVISRTLNQGTKMRYNNVKNVIEGFQRYHSREILKTKETSIIYLKNIDTNYIELFRNYLLVVLKNTQNTSNYKLKCLKSIINKSIQEGYYNFNRNPFINVKFSHPETKIEILDLKDIEKLIKTDFKEVYRRTIKTSSGENLWGKEIPLGVEERNKRNKRYIPKHTLNDIRNYFLFQLFSQGIRVSDLITLRWMNFITTNGKLKISKKMVKTKDEITILVNDKMIQILSNYVVRYKTENTQVYNDLDEKIIGLRGIIDNFYFLIGPENKFYKELMDNVCIEENLVIKNLLIHIKVDESMVHKYISLNKDKRKHPLSKTINPLLEMYNREKEIQLPILKKKLNLLIKNKQKTSM
jgi:integrase